LNDPSKPRNWEETLCSFEVNPAGQLTHVLDGTLKHMTDDTEFAYDHIFCEWIYWIDFEQETLEVCGGSVWRWNFAELEKEMMIHQTSFASHLLPSKVDGDREAADNTEGEDQNTPTQEVGKEEPEGKAPVVG
jgi:hypothetical protein